jgi:hypothetical protein
LTREIPDSVPSQSASHQERIDPRAGQASHDLTRLLEFNQAGALYRMVEWQNDRRPTGWIDNPA